MNAEHAKARVADAKLASSQKRSALPSGRETYRVLQDYQDELKALAEDNPGLVKPVVLPKRSFQGRELMGVEIAKNVEAKDDGRPVYFVMGMHHAREWPSAESALEFAHLLAKGFGSDPRITSLLERERVVVVPMINPDGFVESREGGALGIPDPADSTGITPLQTVEGVALLGRLVRVPAQELRRRGAERRRAVHAAVRGGPEPQLRQRMGRPGRRQRPDDPVLPRHRPVLRARDPGGLGVQPPAAGDEPHHAAQRRGARAAPAGAARRRQGAGRAADEGARRRHGDRDRLHVAVLVRALRHLGDDRRLHVRRAGRVRVHDRDRPGRRAVPHAVPDRRGGRVDRQARHAGRGQGPARGAAAGRRGGCDPTDHAVLTGKAPKPARSCAPQGVRDRDEREVHLRAGLPELVRRRHAARLRGPGRQGGVRRPGRDLDGRRAQGQLRVARQPVDAAVRRRAVCRGRHGAGRRAADVHADRRREQARDRRRRPGAGVGRARVHDRRGRRRGRDRARAGGGARGLRPRRLPRRGRRPAPAGRGLGQRARLVRVGDAQRSRAGHVRAARRVLRHGRERLDGDRRAAPRAARPGRADRPDRGLHADVRDADGDVLSTKQVTVGRGERLALSGLCKTSGKKG